MKQIALLGAFDRYNYGDLLFPLILKKYLIDNMENISLDFYGLIENDLTAYGGFKTKSFKELVDKGGINNKEALILVGGEMLGATWGEMHLCLVENSISTLFLRFVKKILGTENADLLSGRILQGNNTFLLPWVPNPNLIKSNVKVLYNTVGGSNIGRLSQTHIQYIKDSLNNSAYLSVRDKETFIALKENGYEGNVDLYPDSAIIMSDVYKKEWLNENVSTKAKSIIDSMKNGYIIFQINKHLATSYIGDIVEQLEQIYKRTQLPVVLLPIGTAKMHEDHIPLSKISTLLRTPNIYANVENVIDTMALIAHSELYLGTSLHGAITALSFAIPHAGVTKKVQKLEAFLNTWGINNYSRCIEIDELGLEVQKLLDISDVNLNIKSNELIKLGQENFKNIVRVLNN